MLGTQVGFPIPVTQVMVLNWTMVSVTLMLDLLSSFRVIKTISTDTSKGQSDIDNPKLRLPWQVIPICFKLTIKINHRGR